MPQASQLQDAQLEIRLKAAVADERERLVSLLELLAEFERRRLHAKRSFSTLFDYCVRELGYSEGAAIRRVFAARAVRDHPMVGRRLAQGKITLTAVYMLAPHLCAENCADILKQAAGKSTREVRRIVAALKGEDPGLPRETVRPLAGFPKSDGVAGADAPLLAFGEDMESSSPPVPTGPLSGDAVGLSSGASVEASPEVPRIRCSRVSFVVEDDILAEAERLREIMRGRLPGDGLAGIFAAGVRALLEKHDPRRKIARREARARNRASTDRRGSAKEKPRVAGREAPKNQSGGIAPRRIPEAVRDEVWRRDGGRCSFRGPDGRRCAARRRLEFDHVVPVAAGGRSDLADGLRLLCRPHNLLEARRMLGDKIMDRALEAARGRSPPER